MSARERPRRSPPPGIDSGQIVAGGAAIQVSLQLDPDRGEPVYFGAAVALAQADSDRVAASTDQSPDAPSRFPPLQDRHRVPYVIGVSLLRHWSAARTGSTGAQQQCLPPLVHGHVSQTQCLASNRRGNHRQPPAVGRVVERRHRTILLRTFQQVAVLQTTSLSPRLRRHHPIRPARVHAAGTQIGFDPAEHP